jgi:hypothetical protein
MKPTVELRFVKRGGYTVDPLTGQTRPPRMILQQKWVEQVVVTIGNDPDNQITEWREEWRDVPVEESP